MATNFIPLAGELIIYDVDDNHSVTRAKIGDGITPLAELPWANIASEQITVNLGENGTVGGYKTGDVIEAGTDIKTILNKLFITRVLETYKAPTASISNNGGSSGNVESGSTVTMKVKTTFTKNDAGNATSYIYYKDGVEISGQNGSTCEIQGIQVTDDTNDSIPSSVTLTSKVNYAEGAKKPDNLGDPSPGWITAGQISATGSVSVTAKRNAFYGGATSLDLSSGGIRSLSGKKLAPGNGINFEFKVTEGQQYIIIAYPASLRNINNITYKEANDPNMKDNFTQSTVKVADARGGTEGLTDYKVYTYAMAVPAEADMTFNVTI